MYVGLHYLHKRTTINALVRLFVRSFALRLFVHFLVWFLLVCSFACFSDQSFSIHNCIFNISWNLFRLSNSYYLVDLSSAFDQCCSSWNAKPAEPPLENKRIAMVISLWSCSAKDWQKPQLTKQDAQGEARHLAAVFIQREAPSAAAVFTGMPK